MSTHSRKHADATQIAEEILKEAAMPRLTASVKEAFEKKNPASIAQKTLSRTKAGKPEPRKPDIEIRSSPSSTATPSKSCTTPTLNVSASVASTALRKAKPSATERSRLRQR